MENTTKPTESERNYSDEQEQRIRDAAPLNLEKAKTLADEIGKTWRSVVAKAQSMGVEYISKPKPTKRPIQATKSDVVAEIAASLNGVDLSGLEKATMGALATLRDALPQGTATDSAV